MAALGLTVCPLCSYETTDFSSKPSKYIIYPVATVRMMLQKFYSEES